MELNIRGNHLEITPSLRTYVEEKIGSLAHYGGGLIRIEVELTYDVSGREANSFHADARIELPGPDLRAEVSASEMHAAIDILQNKLKSQLLKHKERELSKRRRGNRP